MKTIKYKFQKYSFRAIVQVPVLFALAVVESKIWGMIFGEHLNIAFYIISLILTFVYLNCVYKYTEYPFLRIGNYEYFENEESICLKKGKVQKYISINDIIDVKIYDVELFRIKAIQLCIEYYENSKKKKLTVISQDLKRCSKKDIELYKVYEDIIELISGS